ncbi:MAG: hypothetical protein IPN94_23510 [Sphingobacteriales bacterium]|nr:hypothetical protein [Sphingobacteriales bacterium]
MGTYGYALQIYCDFSGYTDMAIGIAPVLCYHSSTQFRCPYQSASITEVLGAMAHVIYLAPRDYLYIPLAANRLGQNTHLHQPANNYAFK